MRAGQNGRIREIQKSAERERKREGDLKQFSNELVALSVRLKTERRSLVCLGTQPRVIQKLVDDDERTDIPPLFRPVEH